jgi:hypothetical protein
VYFIRLRKTLESGALRDMKVSFNGGHALLLVGEASLFAVEVFTALKEKTIPASRNMGVR